MTTELRVFDNQEFGDIRAVEVEGKPYVVGIDAARALGYAKPSQAVIDHCKGIRKLGIPSSGGTQETNIIPEGDLYRLIAHSHLPAAEKFERWIFDEVLPEIRKNGGYLVDNPNETEDELLARSHEIALRVLARREERIRELQTTIGIKDQQLIELQPKASYYDVILNTKDAISVTKIAKDYGKSAIWLNEYLHSKGVQFKQGDIWLLYAKFAEQGYTCTKTHSHPAQNGEIHSKIHTYWTQKGRLFLYELLKKDGVLPLIEQESPAA
jgi:prophage antirepressor-like protein